MFQPEYLLNRKIHTDNMNVMWNFANGYLITNDETPMSYLYFYTLTTNGGVTLGQIMYVHSIKKTKDGWSIVYRLHHKSARLLWCKVPINTGIIPISMK